MQVNAAASELVRPQGTAAPVLRVVGGAAAALPPGQLLAATVKQAVTGEAVLSVNGTSVVVRGTPGLQPGATLLVRVNPGASRTSLDLVGEVRFPKAGGPVVLPAGQPVGAAVKEIVNGQAVIELPGGKPLTIPANGLRAGDNVLVLLAGRAETSSPANQAPATAAPSSLPTARVEVLGRTPDGGLLVQLEGRPAAAQSAEPLQVGGRYVVEVQRTEAGTILRPVSDGPALPAEVATAVLRDTPQPTELGPALRNLFAGLAKLASPASAQAGAALRDVLTSFVAAEGQPPTAQQLRALVEDGGLQYEAKLAHLAAGDAGAKEAAARDVKGQLLRLLHDAPAAPAGETQMAARAVLERVEFQQAANVIAQAQGEPYVIQVPLPLSPEWKTLHLSVAPDDGGPLTPDGRPRAFSILMHVELDGLGDTWIDASVHGDRLRAVLYVSDAAGRERLRAELGGLRQELRHEGFTEVLADVRSAAELPERQRRRGAALRGGVPESVSLLDVRA